MDFSIDEYLQSRFISESQSLCMPLGRQEDWAPWKARMTRCLLDAIGGLPASKPLGEVVELERVQMDGYTRLRVVLDHKTNLPIPVYVLIPDGANQAAAVVALHGHGYGSRDIVGLRPDGTPKSACDDPGYQQNFALELMRQGFVVIAPELFGFGDRRLKEDTLEPLEKSSCTRAVHFLWMLGETLTSLRVWDVIRSIDYLAIREDVDINRVGVMGISGGGLVSLFSAALEKRINAVVVSGYFNTFRESVMAVDHCADNFFYNILSKADLPDIAGLITPRPLLLEAGKEDDIFPICGVYSGYMRLKEAYATLDAHDKLELDVFEGGHRIHGERAYPFLKKWLEKH